MKFRNQKGYAVTDIAISVVIITIFISVIAVLISRFNSSANEIKYKEEAVAIAVGEIEAIKKEEFTKYEELNKDSKVDADGNSLINIPISEEGFYKTITIEDYTDTEGNGDKRSGLVKKVTVTISYMFQGKEESVELSTIISKEN